MAVVIDEHRDPPPDDAGEYCREVEAYLCRKNDGHLIRIAGPSFARVSGWARQGVPLNVVYRGIDQYFDRYYARGGRRRPVHIDFCEGDVLAVFDEWRRAIGFHGTSGDVPEKPTGESDPSKTVRAASPAEGRRTGRHGRRANGASDAAPADQPASGSTGLSLVAHVERVIVRLTTLRAGGRLAPAADAAVDAAIRELDAARRDAARLPGEGRTAFVSRLREIDAQLAAAISNGLGHREQRAIERDADADLAPFRAGMTAEAYDRARADNFARLLRQRTGLPVVAYDDGP